MCVRNRGHGQCAIPRAPTQCQPGIRDDRLVTGCDAYGQAFQLGIRVSNRKREGRGRGVLRDIIRVGNVADARRVVDGHVTLANRQGKGSARTVLAVVDGHGHLRNTVHPLGGRDGERAHLAGPLDLCTGQLLVLHAGRHLQVLDVVVDVVHGDGDVPEDRTVITDLVVDVRDRRRVVDRFDDHRQVYLQLSSIPAVDANHCGNLSMEIGQGGDGERDIPHVTFKREAVGVHRCLAFAIDLDRDLRRIEGLTVTHIREDQHAPRDILLQRDRLALQDGPREFRRPRRSRGADDGLAAGGQ